MAKKRVGFELFVIGTALRDDADLDLLDGVSSFGTCQVLQCRSCFSQGAEGCAPDGYGFGHKRR